MEAFGTIFEVIGMTWPGIEADALTITLSESVNDGVFKFFVSYA